jgi:transcriptional regulator with XRE-family HTH domain
MDDDGLGANLMRLRDEKRLSLEDAARLSGISKARLIGYESGNVRPRIKTMISIIRGWQITRSEFRNLIL